MNVRLLVAYDGTDFRGLAPNEGVRTVVGELRRVLEPLIGVAPDIVMSGRTDAGVHSWGQVLSFEMPDGAVELDRIQKSVNARLGPEVVVRQVTEVPVDFSARFSAVGRSYRYHVANRPQPDPFTARTAWWVAKPLDLAAMRAACPHLIGEHDFSSFCRQPKPAPGPDGTVTPASLVRRVTSADWLQVDDGYGDGAGRGDGTDGVDDDGVAVGSEHAGSIRFDISGSAFCHQMVRSIVGFLVAVGVGKRRPEELPEVLAARDRAVAEQPAPPQGLTLWSVDYPPDHRVGSA